MGMYRVTFYKKKEDARGHITMNKVVLDTNKVTMAEAFEEATNHGADPFKNILFQWIEG